MEKHQSNLLSITVGCGQYNCNFSVPNNAAEIACTCNNYHTFVGKAWTVQSESTALCFRDVVSYGDNRYALFVDKGVRVLGTYNIYPQDSYQHIVTIANWVIEEVQGWLVFRTNDYTSIFVFFPSSGIVNIDPGDGSAPPCSVSETYYAGNRWRIVAENGLLVFRDVLSGGDHRFAFGRSK